MRLYLRNSAYLCIEKNVLIMNKSMYDSYMKMEMVPAGAILDHIVSKQQRTKTEIAALAGLIPQRLNDLIKGPFVFVHINKNNDVTYYILTRDEVIELINTTDDDYFARKKDKSKEDYPMALWCKDLAPFKDHWDSLWK